MACLVQNSTGVDSSSNSNWSPLYGGARIDQDTIQYIHKFYCKDCRMEKQAAEQAKAAAGGKNSADQQPTSPQNSLEEFSLQQTMDKNKESLKRKLMLRRSVIELVDQGIYPPLKTPPAFAEQSKQLERAKTGDLLRHKIQHRPDRQSLVQQNILEDTKVDPSLHERQRQLKRARLADGLNDKLSHRPGPLELVEENILKTDENLAEAIKEGRIQFQKTCEGEDLLRTRHFVFDEESNNSDGALSPTQGEDSNLSDVSNSSSILPPTIDIGQFLQKRIDQGQTSPVSKATVVPPGQPYAVPSSHSVLSRHHSGSGSRNGNSNSSSNKSRPKKPKPKTQPKVKVIKFHEYKGPPNIIKNLQILQQNQSTETPYHILLQQQQLFLQCQLEFQQKNLLVPHQSQKISESQVITQNHNPASGKMVMALSPQGSTSLSQSQMLPSPPSIQIQQHMSPPPPPHSPQQESQTPSRSQQPAAISAVPKLLANLEEMKVADLKAELKKRNLPVSGSKPQLIGRLRPYTEAVSPTAITSSTSASLSATESNSSTGSLPSIQTVVFSTEESMITNSSPPTSPPNTGENSSMPMSPDIMDITSNLVMTKSHINNINNMPMTVDQVSRPPSVAPADGAPMDIDHIATLSPDFSHNLANSVKVIGVISQPQQLSPEEICKQQRKTIEELQRQLQESQMQLKIQQQYQQVQKAPQSPPLVLNTIVNVSPELKVPPPVQQSKQIQIPAHLLQKSQSTQPAPTMIIATSSNDTAPESDKPTLNEIFSNSPSLSKVNFSCSSVPATVTPFIMTPAAEKSKGRSPSPINGISHSRSSSVPVTAKDNQKLAPRTGTSTYYSIPMKEPPKYDEVIKSRHQLQSPGLPEDNGTKVDGPVVTRPASVKCQAMDDVLEILIRNGELPPSAAQEPPPTPKTTTETTAVATESVSQANVSTQGSSIVFSHLTGICIPSTTTNTATCTVNKSPVVASNIVIKQEPESPEAESSDKIKEFVDMSEVFIPSFSQDLSTMDWTPDHALTSLELLDSAPMMRDGKIDVNSDAANVSCISKADGNTESDLVTLDLRGDMDNSPSMQIDVPDVSDWLGFTTNPPNTFTSDPILTPKSQQEVLDMFNFDDSDFSTPADLQCGMDWDKLTDPSTSSS